MIPYSTSHSLCGSNAQHPQVHGWKPPRMTSEGLGTAPHLLPLEKGVLEEVKGQQNNLSRALHWRTGIPFAVMSTICTLLAPSWSERAAPGMSPLCPAQASLPKLPLCKITISPPCLTLPTLFPPKNNKLSWIPWCRCSPQTLVQVGKNPFSSFCY